MACRLEMRFMKLSKKSKNKKMLLDGNYEMVTGKGWGFFDEFFIFLSRQDYYNLMNCYIIPLINAISIDNRNCYFPLKANVQKTA